MKFVGHEGQIHHLVISPDNSTLISHSVDDHTFRFWSIATRAELLKVGTPEEAVLCMDLSPSGNLLVVGVEHNGHYGLRVHRLGPDRDSLPNSFDFSAVQP